MPSTVTHSYFILDVYNKLDIDTRILLKDQKEKLKIFAQSMDPLNFYTSVNFKKGKKVRDFSLYFHTQKTGDYIITLINYIKYNYYGNNPEVLAYLYGIISHYILDTTIHPYVYYKTGEFKSTDKSTYKYNSKHHELETAIDRYLIKKNENLNPRKYKHYKYLFNIEGFSNNLKDIIDFSFKETYKINNFNKEYLKSIKNMKKAFRLFRYDPIGIKKMGYYIFDFITPQKILNSKFLSYNYTANTYDFYLNTNKNIWYNPTTKEKKYNNSFEELYNKSIKKCISTINSINNYIYNTKKVDINRVIKNISYKTGIDIDKEQELKYFEF